MSVEIDIQSKTTSAEDGLSRINRGLAEIIRSAANTGRSLENNLGKNFKDLNKRIEKQTNAFKKGSKETDKSLQSTTTGAKKASTQFERMGRSSNKAALSTTRSSKQMTKSIGGVTAAVTALITGLGTLATVGFVAKSSDGLILLQNRLKLVEKSTVDVINQQKRLYKISADTRSQQLASTDLYVNLTRSMQRSGKVNKELALSYVTTLNKMASLSGSSSTAISAAMVQLNQGLASAP